MIERAISFSLKQRALILLAVSIVAAWGAYSFVTIPVDAFPDVSNIQVEIVGTSPGLAPFEIERFVTHPIEMSMRGLPGLALMRSVTKFGISVVTLVFDDDTDIYFARQLVFERLAEAGKNVPEGVSVGMGPVSTALGEIYQYTLEGPEPPGGLDPAAHLGELRTLQDWVVTPLLKSVPGVNEVNSFGGYIRQFDVALDPARLLQYGVTVDRVYAAIQRNNANVGGNIIDRHSEQLIVRGLGMIRSESDIGNIVLRSEKGIPILVKDVARVAPGHAVRQGAAVKDGVKECVGGIVMMLRGENSRDVIRRVEARVAEINGEGILPGGLKIVPFYERSEIVEASLRTVITAILLGAALVLIVLSFFLGSVRGALIVILALPLSALLTFIIIRALGLPANLMSLGGLAISIGMIIDAAIIQVENVERHLGATRDAARLGQVFKAVLEVRRPSIFGELIIALTFVPILSLQGIEGKMFSPLALTVAIALLASLLLSIFVIPVLCFYILRPAGGGENIFVRAARRFYLPQLRFALRRRTAVILGVAVLLAAAVMLIPRLGREFIPVMDEGAFDMDIQLLPGIALDEAVRVSLAVERKLMEFPELETIVSRTGQTGVAIEARGVDKTGYVGHLKPRKEWTSARTKDELFNRMRDSLASVPGMAFAFSQPIQCRIDELIAGTRAQLIVRLFGEDLEVLKAKAEEMAEVLGRLRGTTDLMVERIAGQLYLSIRVDRDKIARHGLNVQDVLDVVEIAVAGKSATSLYEENRFFGVVVRFDEAARSSEEALRNILIRTPAGADIPLVQLADIETGAGPVQISRENGERRIGIELNIKGRDIGSYVEEARRRIREEVSLPAGYHMTWGGQFENQERAMRRLLLIAPVTIGLILTLLFLTFRSVRLSLLILLTLPFSLIGGVFALYAAGLYLSVPASIGFIALFGIAVLNGIVLVSYISQLRQSGLELREAILQGCAVRLRPVLMTAMITILSLIPLLFAQGPGSEVERPLAVVVVGGLATSTFLTLMVIPVLYSFLERKRTSREGTVRTS